MSGLIGLNEQLFAQLQRLNDPDLTEDQIRIECERSKAMAQVGKEINANVANIIKLKEMRDMRGEIPRQLKGLRR